MKVRIKICCINSINEAQMAIRLGASAIGLVSQMPSGPGVISEDLIEEIAASVPPSIGTFLLTCMQNVNFIVEQQKRCKTNTIQICDRLTNGTYKELKAALPGISIVQVIHVSGEESIDEAVNIAPHVNGILLDSGNQNLKIKELGGTGRVHNWEISRRLVEQVKIPVFLAGGLNPDNVTEVIRIVKPFGVDICSGLRVNGYLDENKLKAFIENVSVG